MDSSEEYIKDFIVHPNVKYKRTDALSVFPFSFVYVMYLNIASDLYGK